jgi:spore maturation protein A
MFFTPFNATNARVLRKRSIFRKLLAYIYAMNVIFTIVFLISTLLLFCTAPDLFLGALLEGAGKGASICISLIATYSVWLGLMHVWEDSGLARYVARFTKPLVRKLFKTNDEETLQTLSMNISVNLLGISGAATPYGIRAANLLDKSEYAEYASAMLFVLNATSLQLIPTSIIGVRVAMHSIAPNNVVIPTFLASLLSTLLGAFLTRLLIPPHKIEEKMPSFLTSSTLKQGGQV